MNLEEELEILKHIYYNSTNLTIYELKKLEELLEMIKNRLEGLKNENN